MKKLKSMPLNLFSILLLLGCVPTDSYDDNDRYIDSDNAEIRIHNDYRSDEDIAYVYFKTGSSWGSNELIGYIDPDETEGWTVYSCDRRYSIRVEYDNGSTRYIDNKYIKCGRSYTFTARL